MSKEWPGSSVQSYDSGRLIPRGTWGAQSVKHLTLDFGSGHDLMVVRLRTALGSTLTAWSLLGILSLSLSLCLTPACTRTYSLSR